MVLLISLTVVGLAALAFGIYVWRHAARIVLDARQTLLQMFGDTLPGLFTDEPEPKAARIAGAGMILLGVGLLAGAVVVFVVQ